MYSAVCVSQQTQAKEKKEWMYFVDFDGTEIYKFTYLIDVHFQTCKMK